MKFDRVLQYGGGDAIRRNLAQLQAIARTDTTAERVEASEPEMIHQSQVISRVGVPAMVSGYGAARPASIALIHRHDPIP